MDLYAIAAGVLLVSLTIYLLTGGADFGAGFWELIARGEQGKKERHLITHALAPIWEANHVWLIVAIVILSGAFPKVLAVLATALHVPLLCMLVGITLRGTAFTFRHYGPEDDMRFQKRWGTIFSVSSALTPVFLGICLGAVVQDGIVLDATGAVITDFFSDWLAWFPVAVGVFTCLVTVFLAAVYLAAESKDEEISNVFCHRALVTGVLLGVTAWLLLFLARFKAPTMYHSLLEHPLAWPFHGITAFVAVVTLYFLHTRQPYKARSTAIIQVIFIMAGLGFAQYPFLVTPSMTIYNAGAPVETLSVLLQVVFAGSLLLAPAFAYLFWIFKFKNLPVA